QQLLSLWFGIAAVPIIGRIERLHENDESENTAREAPANKTKAKILAAVLGLKRVPIRKIEEGDAGAIPRTSSCYSKPDSTFMIQVSLHIRMLWNDTRLLRHRRKPTSGCQDSCPDTIADLFAVRSKLLTAWPRATGLSAESSVPFSCQDNKVLGRA
ncbi:hypothetical protein D4R75_03760, partial [bacterium]